MVEYKIISARISSETKKKIDLYKINVSEIIRKAMEEEIKRREDEKLGKSLENFQETMKKIPANKIIEMIREDRDSR
jgi:antitoxin CcdA